ncbi:serine/threonine-protein kinase [Haliangium ochraceum]|uniref:Serine/threonine protein kinase n=1 Tax=Haliangium ochraceum (strain DSM 14365 / JCM 11303 / SMP-2) TaxID=502025 RepID=D0LHR9_HALO1|nr:serine/threonine-protein kinase [Haliangium ochraceum]ACY12931.1 serine/threonine protein kinase [Haliangium ochraceum DSM 14365]
MPVCPRCRERFANPERFCPTDGSVLVEDLDLARIGTEVGNYHLHEILGRGGMGTVYRAEHIYIKKRVAIKVLHAQFAKYEEAVVRFLREAQAASSIQHPNIVDVTDFGHTPDGGVFFVMEYLEGTSLEDKIEKNGFIELHRALNIANQMSLALAAAHEKHIVHRDLKPDNVMLIRKPGRRNIFRAYTDDEGDTRIVTERENQFDFVKILDFGIAKVLTVDEGDTLQGAIFGTPEYMSPEAARGAEVDLRSDIYSVGVILFDMLCGRPPFEADEVQDVLAMHISQRPPSPRVIAPEREITEACEHLVLRALAKDPFERHQSMDEFREELQHCYGSVAYRRNARSIPGAATLGPEGRGRRLTDELDEWIHTEPRLSAERVHRLTYGGDDDESTTVESSMPMMSPRDTLQDIQPPAVAMEPQTEPNLARSALLTPEEEDRLAAAVDAALDDELEDF